MGLPLKTSRKLQLIQNAAVHVLVRANKGNHIIPVLQDLQWLPISFHGQFKVLVLTCKALDRLGPGYLRDSLHHHHLLCALHLAEEALLYVPLADKGSTHTCVTPSPGQPT